MTYTYETRVFVNGKQTFSAVKELSSFDLMMHKGKATREAFLELINSWNGNGLIGYGATHNLLYMYRAI